MAHVMMSIRGQMLDGGVGVRKDSVRDDEFRIKQPISMMSSEQSQFSK